MAAKTEKFQILTWLIGKQLFGMELAACREVVQDRRITTVPYAKENVAGIVNLRGDVVTVLDLGVMLGYNKTDDKEKTAGDQTDTNVIIRLKSDTQQVALKADAIYDIMEIESKSIEPSPAHLNELETRFIDGIAMMEKGLVVILNSSELMKAS